MKKLVLSLLIILSLFILACGEGEMKTKENKTIPENYEVATFAGGCFWCTESAFEALDGIEAISGYAGGEEVNPTYKDVSAGLTGHRESIQVYYDPTKYTYEQLLKTFWHQIDPTDDEGSFVDRGFQYTSAIFYHNEEQKRLAEESLKEIEESGKFDKRVVTKIIPFTTFYPAEEYHQDYHIKNPIRYKYYRGGSGRDDFIEENWQDENTKKEYTKEELKEKLTPLQYHVTQEDGTEPPFDNIYNDEKREGIYVDIVTGTPVFSSIDKFDSGTGWPSFTKPLVEENIKTKLDFRITTPRTEVESVDGTHLGHVFNDGPKEAGGKRYCLNSAALRFVPKEDLEKEGYGEYLYLFNNN